MGQENPKQKGAQSLNLGRGPQQHRQNKNSKIDKTLTWNVCEGERINSQAKCYRMFWFKIFVTWISEERL